MVLPAKLKSRFDGPIRTWCPILSIRYSGSLLVATFTQAAAPIPAYDWRSNFVVSVWESWSNRAWHFDCYWLLNLLQRLENFLHCKLDQNHSDLLMVYYLHYALPTNAMLEGSQKQNSSSLPFFEILPSTNYFRVSIEWSIEIFTSDWRFVHY